jgi:hypothetical protein
VRKWQFSTFNVHAGDFIAEGGQQKADGYVEVNEGVSKFCRLR